jgi:hypothetical protein
MRLKPDPENFTALMAFCGRTWPNIRPLVLQKDPRGLLLLAYWFALVKQVGQWWIVERARSECMAIVRYLAELQDPTITPLLAFPASFGQTGLSAIWEPLVPENNPYAAFEKYFSKYITPQPDTSPETLRLTMLPAS